MFHGGDVCRILGYARPNDAITSHCKRAKILKHGETPYLEIGPRGALFIPESDVYRLVMRSNMPHAERFQTWVCEEVIPSLRKTGRYQIGAPAAQVPAMVPLIKIAEQYPDSPHEVASLGYAFR